MAKLTTKFDMETAVLPDGSIQYNLKMAVTEADGGITPAVFVFAINQVSGADEFSRVAALQDLSVVSEGKALAQTKGESLYRVNYATRSYTDPDVAVQARDAAKMAIDKLIADFKAYTSIDKTKTYTLTGADPVLLDKLKTEFNTIESQITTHTTRQSTLQTEIDNLQLDITTQQRRIETLTAARASILSSIEPDYSRNVVRFTEISGQLDTFQAYTELTAPHKATIVAYKATVDGYKTAADNEKNALVNRLAPLDSQINTEEDVIRSMYADIEAKNYEITSLDMKIMAARRQQDVTRSSILQLEPTFTGTTTDS